MPTPQRKGGARPLSQEIELEELHLTAEKGAVHSQNQRMLDQFHKGRMFEEFVLADRWSFQFPYPVEFRLVTRQIVSPQYAGKVEIAVSKEKRLLIQGNHVAVS
jgi:hypothetical protein